jgi:hypothetical protein
MNNSNGAIWKATSLPNAGLLIELGPQRRKNIDRLKQGSGTLARQIRGLVDQSRNELGIDDKVEIIPVVLMYRRDDPKYTVIFS